MVDKARVRAHQALCGPRALPPSLSAMGDPDQSQSRIGFEFSMLQERELHNPDPESGGGISEVRVYEKDMWDARVNEPLQNGLLDERMGPVRARDTYGNAVACPVCSNERNADPYVVPRNGHATLCPGHFGHIVLPGAVWHPFTVRYIVNLLRAFCWHCGGLPGTDAANASALAHAHDNFASRIDRVEYLGKRFEKVAHCAQCHARARCKACRSADAQCDSCASLLFFRPRLRTDKQAHNEQEKVVDAAGTDAHAHAGAEPAEVQQHEAGAAHARAVSKSTGRSGFPCDAKLDGFVSSRAQLPEYARFARRVYGRYSNTHILIMHGERVRALLAGIQRELLLALREHAGESAEDVRRWFEALVPRVMPVVPNPARPCELRFGSYDTQNGASPVQADDLTHRYADVVDRCHQISRKIDASAPSEQPALFYDTIGPRKKRLSAVAHGRIYDAPRQPWFAEMPADNHRFIALYGEMQYYCTFVLSERDAKDFLPSTAAAHGIGGAAAQRRRGGAQVTVTRAGGGESKKSAVAHSLRSHIDGKEGLIRKHLNGKRGDETARSVITPDPSLALGGVRLPRHMAERLHVTERVNALQVVQQTTRAERARTGDYARKRHTLPSGAACAGCARCEELPIGEHTELCMWNAARDERVCITAGRSRERTLAQPVHKHAHANETGAYIERNLAVGDVVVLNRQPSLHAPSMQTFRIEKISDAASIGINPLVCKPFNADFDGDEMNVHVPLATPARVEAMHLLGVAECFVSTRNAAPLIGLLQDSATGMHLLTQPDTFLDHGEMCALLFAATPIANSAAHSTHGLRLPEPALRVRDKRSGRWRCFWTGLQAANVALPPRDSCAPFNFKQPRAHELHAQSLNYPPRKSDGSSAWHSEVQLPMLVRNGEFVYGTFYKRTASASAGSIQRAIGRRTHVEGGSDEANQQAVRFVNCCGWLADAFLVRRGFSIGVGDCNVWGNHVLHKGVHKTATALEGEVQRLLVEDKELMRGSGYADRISIVERRIQSLEQRTFDECVRLLRAALSPRNAFVVMQVSGAKGGPLNQGQIMGCLGGNQLQGQRVCVQDVAPSARALSATAASGNERDGGCESTMAPYARKNLPNVINGCPSFRTVDHLMTHRLLPHIPRGVYPGGRAGGFVANSFLTGLDPIEMFRHAQAGREGLVDTAIKTADTGDQMRCAMKSHEDVALRYDGTVRNAAGQIVSFRYGAAGADPRAMCRKSLEFLAMPRAALLRCVAWHRHDARYSALGRADRALLDDERRAIDDALRCMRELSDAQGTGTDINTPNDLWSLIVGVCDEVGLPAHGLLWRSTSDERIAWFRSNTTRVEAAPFAEPCVTPVECVRMVSAALKRWHSLPGPQCLDQVTAAEVRLRLCSKQVVCRMQLTATALERVLGVFEEVLQRSRMEPGAPVGVLSVQGIGEPATQMTLNVRCCVRARTRARDLLCRERRADISLSRQSVAWSARRRAAHEGNQQCGAEREDEGCARAVAVARCSARWCWSARFGARHCSRAAATRVCGRPRAVSRNASVARAPAHEHSCAAQCCADVFQKLGRCCASRSARVARRRARWPQCRAQKRRRQSFVWR